MLKTKICNSRFATAAILHSIEKCCLGNALSLRRWHLHPHSVPFFALMLVLGLVAVLLRVLVLLVFVLLSPVRISIPVPALLVHAIPLAAPLANPICTCTPCNASPSKARQSPYSQLQRQNKQALAEVMANTYAALAALLAAPICTCIHPLHHQAWQRPHSQGGCKRATDRCIAALKTSIYGRTIRWPQSPACLSRPVSDA